MIQPLKIIKEKILTIFLLSLSTSLLSFGIQSFSFEEQYNSTVRYRILLRPDFMSSREIIPLYERMFFSKDIFLDWKKNNPFEFLSFEQIDKNSGVFIKDRSDRAVIFDRKASDTFYSIYIKNKEPNAKYFEAISSYLDFVNKQLSINIANNLNKLEKKFKANQNTNYYEARLKEENVLIMEKPTLPKQTSFSKNTLFLYVFALTFFLVSLILTLKRNLE